MIKLQAEKILNAIPDMCFVLDKDGKVLDFKPAEGMSPVLPPKEFIGQNIADVMPPEVASVGKTLIQEVLKTGTVKLQEYSLKLDGETKYYESRLSPLDDDKVLSIVRDVTEPRKTEEALKESEYRHRRLFVSSPTPMYVYDTETLEILAVNEAMASHYGFSEEELLGMSLIDIRPSEEVPALLESFSDLEGGLLHRKTWKHWKKDGTVIAVDVTSSGTIHQGRDARIVLCSDVTERERTEKALADSEERFRSAFHTSPDSVNLNRLEDGTYEDINQGFTRISGYTREEVIGKTSLEIDIWVDPNDRKKLLEELGSRGEVENLEAKFRMKDGTIVNGLMSAKVMLVGGVPHILSITRDITRLKEAEESVRASLREKEVLLKEVHHRVKNNLQVISGLLNLQAHHIDDPLGKEVYKESQNRVITMALIHEELYQKKDLSQVNFPEYLKNLAENLFASYGLDKDRVNLDVEAEDAQMVIDTAIPCGLIVNELVTNSLKHAFPGDRKGSIRITFRTTGNKKYYLSVADTGVGLPKEMDFESTKTLGLKLVSVLAEQLGSRLELDSKAGTRFSLEFREYREAGSALY